jgi:hypothetical protein
VGARAGVTGPECGAVLGATTPAANTVTGIVCASKITDAAHAMRVDCRIRAALGADLKNDRRTGFIEAILFMEIPSWGSNYMLTRVVVEGIRQSDDGRRSESQMIHWACLAAVANIVLAFVENGENNGSGRFLL